MIVLWQAYISSKLYDFKILSDICQVRLDFQVLNLAQPVAATGSCAGDDRDRILLDAGGNDPDRTLCGDLTGQHGILQFYIQMMTVLIMIKQN